MCNKRILYLRSNPVDPDSRVEKQVSSLVDHEYDVEIFGWNRDFNSGIVKSSIVIGCNTVTIYRKGIKSRYGSGFRKNLIPLIRFQVSLLIFLLKNGMNYDVFHGADFDTAFIGFFVAKFYRKKFVYDIFDYYVDSYSVPQVLARIIEKLDLMVINGSDAVIICTEERQHQLPKNSQDNIVIIHNTPAEVFESTKSFEATKDDVTRIVYVGVLLSGRMLVELGKIVSEDSKLELHVGGFGQYENYFIDLSNNYDNIKFYGKLSYDDTLALENTADILTAIYDPSSRNHKYAAPNKFYEALMLGKPLIMIRDTGMSDVVLDYELGVVIDFNENSLKEGINSIVANYENWNNRSKIMKYIYKNEYNWDNMKNRLTEMYDSLW